MTSEEKAKTWAELARRDGDEEAADAIEALIARAEQAEKERDGALRAIDKAGVSPVPSKDGAPLLTLAERIALLADARERAEADNAALLVEMTNISLLLFGEPRVEMALRIAALVTRTFRTHPGAALLERFRALENVRDAAEPFNKAFGAEDAEKVSEDGFMLVLACAAADALKERKS